MSVNTHKGKTKRAPTREQLEVVRLPGGPARVLAGAGSGKTYTMTELIRSRVDDYLRGYGGTPPERTLALTFTVKAAEEMHRRLLETLGEKALKLDVSNFHSYAFSLVRENAAALGLEPEAPVLRRGRAWLMVLEELGAEDLALRSLDLSDPASAADRVLKLLSGTKNDLVDLGELWERTEADLANPEATPELSRCLEERLDLIQLAQRFEARRKERGVLRYEDMLELGTRILSGPVMGEPYSDRYDLVVVDEFQDTNPAQMRFVELLAGGDLSKVVVVGDDLQSIFNFTGATVRNIQRFEEEAGLGVGDATKRLNTNFRSGERLISLANHVARNVHPENSPDDPKQLAPGPNAGPGEISAFVATGDREEAREISARIAGLLQGGASPQDCAVLVRRRSQTGPVVDALGERDIPCEIADVGGLLSRPEISLLSDYLRIAAEPAGCRPATVRALLRPPVRLGEHDLKHLLTAPRGPESALDRPDTVPGLSDEGAERIRHFNALRDGLEAALAGAETLGDFVEEAAETIGLGQELRSSPGSEARISRQYLGAFHEVAREFGETSFLQEFLRYLELVSRSETSEFSAPPSEEADAVRVLTVHRAKGLEFDHVFVPGLSDGVFPINRSGDSSLETAHAVPPPLKLDPDPRPVAAYDTLDKKEMKELLKQEALEEEGRLLYVACTRAAKSLTLSRAHYYGENKKSKGAGEFWDLIQEAAGECGIHLAAEPEAPDSNPNVEEEPEDRDREPDRWPLEAMSGEEEETALSLGIQDWEDELTGLRRDMRAIPETSRPKHVLPAPKTHSPSSLMDFEICPRRYYYEYVFPVPGLDANLEGAQDYGSVVHAYIEGGMSGVPPGPDVGWAGGKGSGGNVGNSGASRAELWQKFEASEYGWRSAEYQLHEGPEPPATGPARMVEVPFALPIEDTEIRGRIDAIFVDGDGTFHIVDWKTGKPDREKFEHRLQLPLYALAASRLWGVAPEKIRLAYAFAPGDEVVEVDTSDGFLEQAEARVRDALGRIKGGSFEPVPSRYGCSRCPVMGIGIDGCPEEVPPE